MLSRGLMALVCLAIAPLWATEYHGIVKFGGLPLPGATLTATQGDKKFVASTGIDGTYSFPNLADGDWNIQIEMLCFTSVKKDVTIAPGVPTADWEMKLLPIEEIKAAAAAAAPTVSTPAPAQTPVQTTSVPNPPAPRITSKNTKKAKPGINQPAPVNTASGFQRTDVNASAAPPPSEAAQATPGEAPGGNSLNQSATDSLAINGSVNNAAASPFGQNQAFGNNRRGFGSLYNGNLSLMVDNSALDARSYSLTGQDTPKAAYNHITAGGTFGGPLRIPHLIPLRSAPNFFFAYQLQRNRTGTTDSALVPTAAQRAGDFSTTIVQPSTGTPFPGNAIPQSLISPQAVSLLRFYPLPNSAGTQYNYQVPIVGRNDLDQLQSRLQKSIGRSNQVFGNFGYQNVRNQNNSIFNFLDRTGTVGYSITANWMHRFNNRIFTTTTGTFNRQTTDLTPYFANRENVSGEAGITGNLQSPIYWGPPQLVFSSGITPLSDQSTTHNHNQTASITSQTYWSHSPHNFTFGGDFRRQQFNVLGQQNPTGSFTFNGLGTGSDFADFLLGAPDTSSIAFGNADKYFRSNVYDLYFTDDWRVTPSLTVNAGLRWDYGSPISELYGRLVNLDIASGFTAAAPVIGNNPTGPLTGNKYPSSLVRPDKHDVGPRIGIAWRPIPGSSLVVRAGYGVNYNTSVYQTIAQQMAQQSPLSKSLVVANSPADPLTLANGFNGSPVTTPNTFAIDPNFRVGYAQSWQLSIQRDLPGGLVFTSTYLGIKGTRGTQEFLPNTYPSGAVNPCPTCLPGYAYLVSNGNSTNEKGNVQLRRRLHSGLTATVQYTYSKAIDDATLGGGHSQSGSVIAQNWLDLSAERGLSSFDQRHLVNFQTQYTTGVGLHGGTLLEGWRGTAFKEWTITSQVVAGTGFPLTPQYLTTVAGTGVNGPIRPDYTGAPLYSAPPGLYLNPLAYTAPAAGQWGNAGRDTITGPDQFSIGASAARTFRLRDRLNLDVTLNSSNPINHPTYQSWVTNIRSIQFGLPTGVNPMRTVQLTMRVRF